MKKIKERKAYNTPNSIVENRSRWVISRDGHRSRWQTVEMEIGRHGIGRSGNRSR